PVRLAAGDVRQVFLADELGHLADELGDLAVDDGAGGTGGLADRAALVGAFHGDLAQDGAQAVDVALGVIDHVALLVARCHAPDAPGRAGDHVDEIVSGVAAAVAADA